MRVQQQGAIVQEMLHPWGLTEQWVAFIAQMDDVYEGLARRRGERYARHTTDELHTIAGLAAAYGLRPGEPVERIAAAEREPALGGAR